MSEEYLSLRLEEPYASHIAYARAKSERYWHLADMLDQEMPGVRFWLADLGYAAFSGFRKAAIIADAVLHSAVHREFPSEPQELFPN